MVVTDKIWAYLCPANAVANFPKFLRVLASFYPSPGLIALALYRLVKEKKREPMGLVLKGKQRFEQAKVAVKQIQALGILVQG